MSSKRIELYPFEAYDLIRRRWVKARYVCEIDQLPFDRPVRITGKPEVRDVPDDWRELTASAMGGFLPLRDPPS